MTVGEFFGGFSDWCNKTIQVEVWDGTYNIEGQPNRAAAVAMQCRVDETIRRVRDMQGEERVSTTTLYVAGGPIGPLDRVTMPAGFKGPTQPPIISVSNVDDTTTGFDHAEVFI